MMRRLAIVLVILALGAMLGAQGFDPYINPHWNMPSLLNPNKLQISHSASFAAGGSSNGQGFYQSMYTNHLFYQLHPKVDLNVNLHFVNFGTATMRGGFDIEGNNDNMSNVLPEFSLQWRPSETTTVELHYSQMPRRFGSPYPLYYWPEP